MSKAQSTSSWSMYGWAHRPKATHLTQCLYVVLQLGNILLLDRCFHSSPNVSSFIILALFYYYYYHHFYFYTVCNDQIYLFRFHICIKKRTITPLLFFYILFQIGKKSAPVSMLLHSSISVQIEQNAVKIAPRKHESILNIFSHIKGFYKIQFC